MVVGQPDSFNVHDQLLLSLPSLSSNAVARHSKRFSVCSRSLGSVFSEEYSAATVISKGLWNKSVRNLNSPVSIRVTVSPQLYVTG